MTKHAFDVLFGCQTIRPELICRITTRSSWSDWDGFRPEEFAAKQPSLYIRFLAWCLRFIERR